MLGKKLSLMTLPLLAAVSLQAQNPFSDPFFNDPFGDDIFKEMMQMQQQMDQMFKRMEQRMHQRSTRLVSPLGTYRLAAQNQFVDKGDHYELATNIPESKENRIDISTNDGILSITAKIVHEKEEKTHGMVSTSRSVQMFQQSVTLPADADEGGIKSRFVNGKLLLTVPKKKTLPVTAANPVKKTSQKATEQKNGLTLPKVDEKLKQNLPVHEEKKREEKEHKPVSDKASMS
jgi:HSP20 family protein